MSESQQTETLPASKNKTKLCAGKVADLRNVWQTLREEADRVAKDEPTLKHLVHDVILSRETLAAALGARLARRLAREDMPRVSMEPLLTGVFEAYPQIVHAASRDLLAMFERDPACFSPLEPLLFFKGFLALTTYRVAHQLWVDERRWLALYFQSVASEAFSVDIHPAARIGCGILLDHATSFVVGETAIIEDDVSILHEVTLGGTGKETGNRHPIIRSGVLLGAGAKILGRVEIGTGAKVGAGSVVLHDVAPHKTVAGVPAIVVGTSTEEMPAIEMNQHLDCCGHI
ncbi:serine O-acetyltransferase [Luteolibacter yonseiensis]|uniref:Serine acetyltransferase n=1 Tax=Luteolibacter yonseiensis TaxID=1144680 RepID=A0A934R8M4_9BACT|nr:serine O-acetyltransferase [Luteolibacter yonseiensis]MBK1817933.1 serine O-acetyltransferase [Luteolibacter yonseiensis]